jgi:hypothetical protein
VGYQYHRGELQMRDDGIEVAGLVAGRVRVAGWLVGAPPAEKVERHHSAPCKLGNEPVVQVLVVREAVQQHDRRLLAGVVACVQRMRAARNEVLSIAAAARGVRCDSGLDHPAPSMPGDEHGDPCRDRHVGKPGHSSARGSRRVAGMARLCVPDELIRIGGDPNLAPKVLPLPTVGRRATRRMQAPGSKWE